MQYTRSGRSGTTTTTTRLGGMEASFGTAPDEVSLEFRLGSPAYIHLREGDYLQEGDAFHRDQLRRTPPALQTWVVVEITPETVVGRDLETGEETEWARDEVERGLALGTYSTNLTDFEWVSVYQVGRWADLDARADGDGRRDRLQPYVSVVAYGDNGLKYGRRYRFAEPRSTRLYLWRQDQPAGGFADLVEARLDERVTEALEREGYVVVDSRR